MRRRWPEGGLSQLRKVVWLVFLAVLLAAPVHPALGQDPATSNVAGIVVDYGDGRVSYALVPFAEDSISGMELLHRSTLPLLTVDFGGMGEGVCKIDKTGCDPTPCRARLCQTGDPDSPFWQYLRRDPAGEWEFVQLGASASTVHDGDVNGWYWTGTTPTGVATSLPDIAAKLGADLDETRAGDFPKSLVVTTGASAGERDSPVRRDILLGGGVILGIAVAGAIAIRRSRQPARP